MIDSKKEAREINVLCLLLKTLNEMKIEIVSLCIRKFYHYCFISEEKYSIESHGNIFALIRLDSLTKLLRQTEVSLCDNQENCNYACGQLSGEFNSWASVTCNHLIESREAKIKFDPTFSLYEIQVRGNG